MEEFIEILGKENPMLKPIKDRMYSAPTEIQTKAIPVILKGHDVIAEAMTGSGKTLAFAAGLLKNTKKDSGIQGLVLTPTRELAEQITKEIQDFSSDLNLDIISIYGGVPINDQIKRLQYAEIVVATPGRILDHLNRNTIDLSKVNTLVLDEADRMLDMGFHEDVEKIISTCPIKRQTLLLSATISQEISILAKKYLKDPIEISAESQVKSENLEQYYYDIIDNLKYSLLKYLLEREKAKLVMIFCNTRKNVDFVAKNLMANGIESMPIHGGFAQDKRNKILESFHTKKVHVLVATDVAARGLDIKEVTHVYNYDIPKTPEEYIHRIGRTARAGKTGKVINIITNRDYESFNNIINSDIHITRLETPFIKRIRIQWMPEKNEDRFGQRNSRRSNYSGSNRRY